MDNLGLSEADIKKRSIDRWCRKQGIANVVIWGDNKGVTRLSAHCIQASRLIFPKSVGAIQKIFLDELHIDESELPDPSSLEQEEISIPEAIPSLTERNVAAQLGQPIAVRPKPSNSKAPIKAPIAKFEQPIKPMSTPVEELMREYLGLGARKLELERLIAQSFNAPILSAPVAGPKQAIVERDNFHCKSCGREGTDKNPLKWRRCADCRGAKIKVEDQTDEENFTSTHQSSMSQFPIVE